MELFGKDQDACGLVDEGVLLGVSFEIFKGTHWPGPVVCLQYADQM